MLDQSRPHPAGLVLENLKKRVGGFELQADFFVRAGERAALLGRSGSGKTTLLRLLAGLESVDDGRVTLESQDITALPPRARGIGFVFQDQALFPSMNVLENILFPLKLKKVSRSEAEARARDWLEKVDLKKHAEASIMTLSGGERQRVAFVRALIAQPRLLLLDEPFSALDRELRLSLCRELVALHELWPAPMVLVTHDETDVANVATLQLMLRVNRTAQSLIHRVERNG